MHGQNDRNIEASIDHTDQALIQGIDEAHRRICSAQRQLFCLIAEVDRRELWRDDGARDMAHWLWMRYGISDWKARRWIASAHALRDLPVICEAFTTGALGIDKVVELSRFATPASEAGLIRWAQGVSPGAIRHRGDLAARACLEEVQEAEGARNLSWWFTDEGRRFGLEAELPAAQGAVVARALERLAGEIPLMPGEEEPGFAGARRADALVALCSGRLAGARDPDRATVVVHARLDGLLESSGGEASGGAELEGGPVIHPQTARRLLCTARVQTVIEDPWGQPVRLGRMSREPPAWMLRHLRYRDRECRFPGCGARRFTQAHHIVWWDRGGTTDLDNLVLVCTFHHRLVHEYGWSLKRERDGMVRWFRPDGTGYRAGPAPPFVASL